MNYRPRTLAFRLPPRVTCRPHLPLPRRTHRSTPRYGVTPGHGNSAVCCRPTRSNVIDAKWLFNWKSDEFNWVSKAKSRLVARGFKQREGIDFGETFTPTVSSSCVRLLSAIACELDLDVCHFDAEQAFV